MCVDACFLCSADGRVQDKVTGREWHSIKANFGRMEKKFKMDLTTQNDIDWVTAGYKFKVRACVCSMWIVCACGQRAGSVGCCGASVLSVSRRRCPRAFWWRSSRPRPNKTCAVTVTCCSRM